MERNLKDVETLPSSNQPNLLDFPEDLEDD